MRRSEAVPEGLTVDCWETTGMRDLGLLASTTSRLGLIVSITESELHQGAGTSFDHASAVSPLPKIELPICPANYAAQKALNQVVATASSIYTNRIPSCGYDFSRTLSIEV